MKLLQKIKNTIKTVSKWTLVLAASMILLAGTPGIAQTGKSTKKVYSIYGLGGATWSGGMSTFGKPYQYYQIEEIIADIKKQPKGTKIICVGHSLGANACSSIQAKVKVDLTVGLDPTWSYPVQPIRGRGINYYSTNWFNPLGHAKYTGKNVKNIPTGTIHTGITYDKNIISAVKKAIGSI